MRELRGKVAVVTGAGGGIGEALAQALVAEGMQVVLADVEAAAVERVAAEMTAAGGVAIAVPTDVSQREQVQALADGAYAGFGAVHLLVNNAGVARFGAIADLTEHDWQWMAGVNIGGVLNALAAFLPRMRTTPGERHILNTGSIAGLVPVTNQGAYGATKHAVVAISESLRRELEPEGIGVSVLCPGAVATRIVDAARNRPVAYGGPAEGPADLRERIAGGMPPGVVARKAIAGIRANELYIVTHPGTRAAVERRNALLLEAYDRQAD